MADSTATDALATPGGPLDSPEVRRILAVMAVFVVAEATILAQFIVVGLLLHAAMIFVLFGVIAVGTDQRMYEALVFVPLLRLLNLGTGIISFRPLVWILGVYTLLFASIALVLRGREVSLTDIGLAVPQSRRQWQVIGLGAGAGITCGIIQWLLDLEQLPVEPTATNAIGMALIFGVLVGFVEELLFRGLLQQWFAEVAGKKLSVVAVSVLFGFMHSIWFSPADVAFAFVVSLALGWLYAQTRNFWSIWAWHALINVVAFAVLPWLVGEGLA